MLKPQGGAIDATVFLEGYDQGLPSFHCAICQWQRSPEELPDEEWFGECLQSASRVLM